MLGKIASTAAVLALLANGALAAEKSFSCESIGGTEEWNVEINLKEKTAAFFDNDTWTIIPLKETKILESHPAQVVYVFEGEDTGSAAGDRLRIAFNQTRLAATVTLNLGQPDQETLKAENGCHAVKRAKPEAR